MIEKKELICIGCPLGCMVTVELEDGEIKNIYNYTCKRGEVYARNEVTNPERIVTSTAKVNNGHRPLASVKTKTNIPKDKIFACMEEINKVTLEAPVHIGDIVIENVAGTGVPVVATCDIHRV